MVKFLKLFYTLLDKERGNCAILCASLITDMKRPCKLVT